MGVPENGPARPVPNAASLIATALIIAIACSFAWYGLMGRFATPWGWPWYAAWVLAILAPPFAFLALRTGSVGRAVPPFLFVVTIGLPRTIVFIDGFNLYYSRLRGTPFKWLDVAALFRDSILKAQDPQTSLVAVRYFTAPVKAS